MEVYLIWGTSIVSLWTWSDIFFNNILFPLHFNGINTTQNWSFLYRLTCVCPLIYFSFVGHSFSCPHKTVYSLQSSVKEQPPFHIYIVKYILACKQTICIMEKHAQPVCLVYQHVLYYLSYFCVTVLQERTMKLKEL